ncbi:hypothetical protein EW026_g6638 [Hermanssonia centrifuga]|uniref:Uncharacterized protein n=1 Tax=Hermanssonia centrifuga TaxID=98765 RepID=A0A4V3X9N9_9APHY|nr:hypothetical protein EW026_g6638 [Hermanssonia centrifuga]
MDSPTTMKTALDIEAYSPPPPVAMFAPNRRLPSGATVQGGVAVIAGGLTDQNLAQHDFNTTSVHPFVHNFTSPIDLVQGDGESYGQTNRPLFITLYRLLQT